MGDRCSVALVHNHYNINLTDQKKKKNERGENLVTLYSLVHVLLYD